MKRVYDLSHEDEQQIADGFSALVNGYLDLAEQRLDAGDGFMAKVYLAKAHLAHNPVWQFSQTQSALLEQQIIDLEERMAKTKRPDYTGVHAAHCCKTHGCKYCDDDCPVVAGAVAQLYPCETCDENERYY